MIPKTKSRCKECKAAFMGNKGKKFCSLKCKADFHNRKNREKLAIYKSMFPNKALYQAEIDLLLKYSPLFRSLYKKC